MYALLFIQNMCLVTQGKYLLKYEGGRKGEIIILKAVLLATGSGSRTLLYGSHCCYIF